MKIAVQVYKVQKKKIPMAARINFFVAVREKKARGEKFF